MNKWAVAAKGVRAIRSAVTVEQVNMAFNYFMLAVIKIAKEHRKKYHSSDFIRMLDDLEEVADEISNLANSKQKLLAKKGGNL